VRNVEFLFINNIVGKHKLLVLCFYFITDNFCKIGRGVFLRITFRSKISIRNVGGEFTSTFRLQKP
jgi:hypothetical protein